jgi:hypothetical protein
MADNLSIQPGRVYWVQLDGIRLRLRANEPSKIVKGWWRCTAQHGSEVAVPESAFIEECQDDPTAKTWPRLAT